MAEEMDRHVGESGRTQQRGEHVLVALQVDSPFLDRTPLAATILRIRQQLPPPAEQRPVGGGHPEEAGVDGKRQAAPHRKAPPPGAHLGPLMRLVHRLLRGHQHPGGQPLEKRTDIPGQHQVGIHPHRLDVRSGQQRQERMGLAVPILGSLRTVGNQPDVGEPGHPPDEGRDGPGPMQDDRRAGAMLGQGEQGELEADLGPSAILRQAEHRVHVATPPQATRHASLTAPRAAAGAAPRPDRPPAPHPPRASGSGSTGGGT